MGKMTRRGTVLGAAVALAAGTLAFAPSSMAAGGGPIDIDGGQDVSNSKVDIYRFADKDRVGTALDAADRTGGVWGKTVILASSQKFPDALAATPLADAVDAPVLLNQEGDTLDPRVKAYLSGGASNPANHHQPVIRNVVLAGGTNVFSNAVRDEIQAMPGKNVIRVNGVNRYQTAAALAGAAIHYASDYEPNVNIFLASGTNFPDALAAGNAAAQKNGIVLLTKGSEGLENYTFKAVDRAKVTFEGSSYEINGSKIAIGGPAAKAAANGSISSGSPVETDQDVVGINRSQTAIDAAKAFSPNAKNFVVASSQNFPDAVVGGAYAANVDGALLLSKNASLNANVANYLADRKVSDVHNVFVFGGPNGALSKLVSQQIAQLPYGY